MLYEETSTLMDYLSSQTVVLMIEPAWMAREATQLIENTKDLYERKLAFDQFMVSPDETFVPFEGVISALQAYPFVRTSLTPPTLNTEDPVEEIPFGMRPLGLPRSNYRIDYGSDQGMD